MTTPSKTGIPIKSNFNLTAAKHKRYSATGNIKLQNAIGLHDEATATAIRNIESNAMEREEEYRREWMAERGMGNPNRGVGKNAIFQGTPFGGTKQNSAAITPHVTAVSTPRVESSSSPRGTARSQSGGSSAKKTVSTSNVEMSLDAAVAYLSSSRRVQLADRYVRKDYFWKLSCETMEGKEVFVLRWRDLESEAIVGHFVSSDVQNIVFPQKNPLLLEVSVGTAPRALVGTGGRAVVSLSFSSEVECKKYGRALLAVIRR